MTDTPAQVQGRCPACRSDSLTIGRRGYVICTRDGCPDPTAADKLLHGEQVAAATPLVCSDERHAAKVAALTVERDEARQHAAAISAQRDRLRKRMNNLADRWEHALAVDKPYARALRAEITTDPFDHSASLSVREYRADDGDRKWAARCWGTDTCDGWLSLDHDTQRWAELARDRHVAEAHTDQSKEG